jgi:hypothetical protein
LPEAPTLIPARTLCTASMLVMQEKD